MLRPRLQLRSCLQLRSYSSRSPTFQEGDRVLLRKATDPSKTHYTKPLTPTLRYSIGDGTFTLSSLISAPIRSTIATHNGKLYRASVPTLEEYILNNSRLVTPIYPHDAAVITSLLDIQLGDRVLEAGTGHGSFTMALLRVGADVTTVEKKENVSAQAQRNIEGYEGGKLLRHGKVNFVAGDEPGNVMQNYPEAEFDVVFLDLPDPDRYFKDAERSLRNDGVLAIWCPSVSQIMKAVESIKQENLQFVMDKTIEFPGGSGSGAGLRRWDVRTAVIRDSVKGSTVSKKVQRGEVEPEEEINARMEMVCRPSVGERIVGGGFLGIFRRKLDGESERSRVIYSELAKKRDPTSMDRESGGLATPPTSPPLESEEEESTDLDESKPGHPELSNLPPSPS